MGARIVVLPQVEQSTMPALLAGLPCEAELRAEAAAGLKSQRVLAGYSEEDWAALLSRILGRPITAAKVRVWESPTQPSPSNHVSLLCYKVAARLVGPAAYEAGLRLVMGPTLP